MLRQNLELVVQYPAQNGIVCRGFHGLHLPAPAFVAFDGETGDDCNNARALGKAVCQELARLPGVGEEQAMPCSGAPLAGICHAIGVADCTKLLVHLFASPAPANAPKGAATLSAQAELLCASCSDLRILPALPAGTNATAFLPATWQKINAAFWADKATELVWPVLQQVGVSTQHNRLFISYLRSETSDIADQLFARLTQAGFDVFLDRCSVPVGVDFQEYLMEDLCDKTIVVLLNSPGITRSHWVGEEIALAKTHRLGLLELLFPTASPRKDVDPDLRMDIAPADLAPPAHGPALGLLTDSALSQIVTRIKTEHHRALYRRRYQLIDNFAAALVAAGKHGTLQPDGSFVVPGRVAGSSHVVALNARPPTLDDFCTFHTHGQIDNNRQGWLISPAPLFSAKRQAQLQWLGGLSNISHLNEAQMTALANRL